MRRLHGVEDDDYAAAGVAWTSRDAAFESIDELRYLRGMSQALYEALAPLVTVYSGRGGLDIEYAPPALIAALTGADVPTVPAEDGAAGRSGARNGTFHVYSSASGGSAAVAAIEAVVRISRVSRSPYTIVDWREPPRVEFPPREGGQG